jgi:hypothetical protein
MIFSDRNVFMKKLALICVLALFSSFASAAVKPEKQTLTSQGKERTYYTFTPEKLTGPVPLLLLLQAPDVTACRRSMNGKAWRKNKASFLPRLIPPTRASGA